MRRFRDISIRRKLTTVVLLTSSVALLVASIVFVLADRAATKVGMVRDLEILADVIGSNSTVALAFDSDDDASEVLGALRADPYVLAACIYTVGDRQFATYFRANEPSITLPQGPGIDGHHFGDDGLSMFRTIMLGNKEIGSLYLLSDTRKMTERLSRYSLIVAVAFLISILVAYLVISRLQRLVSAPINRLAHAARSVSAERDYSIRVEESGEDEVGFLVEKFNEMLSTIQERDAALQDARQGLERRVKERTRELENEIAERKRTEAEKRDRLERAQRQRVAITRLITEEAAIGDDFERAVRTVTEIVAEATSNERVSVWMFDEAHSQIECLDLYEASGGRHSQGMILKAYDFSEYFRAVESDRIVACNDARKDNRTSEFTDDYLDPLGITSMLDVAIRVSGDLVGVVCLEHIGEQRAWQNDEVAFADEIAGQIAQIYADAERHRMEREQQGLQDRLERAERMESLGILAGGVAHDLNNLLGPVVGYSELILAQMSGDDRTGQRVRKIGKSAQDAADVIQDLLTLARRGRYDMVPTKVNDIVKDYVDSPSFEKLSESHPEVDVNVELDESIDMIMGSSAHLAKVVMNLIVNAFDAMPDGGALSVTSSQRWVEKLASGHEGVVPSDYVLLRIRDSGMGIDAKDLARIFEPYYSKKKMGTSGSGLGLSVVYGVVKDHKGYYDILSEPGDGAEFILYFPVTDVEEIAEPVQADDFSGTETVLVVDDVEEQRVMASEILSSLGYQVQVASGGKDAIEYLRHNTVDLALLDMIMEPGFDGLDTYREIVKLHPDQKAVVVSGFSATERVEEMRRLGAGDYVRKPYSIASLGKAVRDELDRAPVEVVT